MTEALLIYPKITEGIQSKYLETVLFNSMPVSLGFLAGYLEDKNIKVKIIDEQLKPLSYDFIKKELGNLDEPKIVGISILTSAYKRACEIARIIKDIHKNTVVIVGGIHPSSTVEECLGEPFFDIVVRGEGEETLYEIIKALRERRNLINIAGFSYKDSGQIVHNPDRGLLQNLDTIPPFPYHLFEDNLNKYKEFGIVVSSRGCPHKCIFCSPRIISQNKYRIHSVERVINDIGLLINKYNQTRISFLDDNILSNKKRFFKIIDHIIENDFHKKAKFYLGVRGKDMTEELCNKLKAANFEVAINFETGTNRMLKFIKKDETIEENINAVMVAKHYGVSVTSVFIFGFPEETEEDRREAIRISRRIPIDSVRFNIAIPYPGTELYDIAKKHNKLNVRGKYENFSVQHYLEDDDLPYVLSPEDKCKVVFDVFWANLSFYLRPAILIKNLFSRNFAGHAISLDSKKSFLTLKKVIMLTIIMIKRFMSIFIRRFIPAKQHRYT